MEIKATNPKDLGSADKVPYDLIPSVPLAEVSVALYEGYRKYGGWNWRTEGVQSGVYIAAAKRHLNAWQEGEDIDPDSGLNHIIKAIAGLIILRDGMIQGNFVDTRPRGCSGFLKPLMEKMREINEKYPECKEPHLANGQAPRPYIGVRDDRWVAEPPFPAEALTPEGNVKTKGWYKEQIEEFKHKIRDETDYNKVKVLENQLSVSRKKMEEAPDIKIHDPFQEPLLETVKKDLQRLYDTRAKLVGARLGTNAPPILWDIVAKIDEEIKSKKRMLGEPLTESNDRVDAADVARVKIHDPFQEPILETVKKDLVILHETRQHLADCHSENWQEIVRVEDEIRHKERMLEGAK